MRGGVPVAREHPAPRGKSQSPEKVRSHRSGDGAYEADSRQRSIVTALRAAAAAQEAPSAAFEKEVHNWAVRLKRTAMPLS